MASESTKSSRIANFFKMTVPERISALSDNGLLSQTDVHALNSANHQLQLSVADKMIENVVGVFGLPMGVALNFLINNKDYVVPLVVEEPSIVAGLSGAARMARLGGGFTATSTEPILIGQVQAVMADDPEPAMQALLDNKADILALANSLHPKMVARGGGAVDIEVFRHKAEEDGREMVVMHLLVDTRDAMGANMVNSMCEGVASLVETLTGGQVFLRILSNLTDRAMVKATVQIPTANLEGKGYTGEQVRDGIILANDLALADPYRAATHNKGIMNGVDAVAIATGNDWRAIEAAAHAYAANTGRYKALTRWYKHQSGDLVGEISIPMKVGTVGGSLESNPSVRINHRLLGSPDAKELAGIMGTIGLAQNFAALRALSTNGIQQNHMTLHARSVTSTAGVPEDLFEQVVEGLIESGEIKVWKAQELMKKLLRTPDQPLTAERHSASGKIILLGEHAVVYGRPAIALPIPLAVEASVQKDVSDGVNIVIPRWGLEQQVHEATQGFGGILAEVFAQLELLNTDMLIEVFPHVPRAQGLGGSSALAVAILRAVNHSYDLALTDHQINDFAFQCEKAAHGTPSGVDNTVATFGAPLWYQRINEQPTFESLKLGQELNLVVGMSGQESLTAETVGQVRNAWKQAPQRYEGIFDQIAVFTNTAREALAGGQLAEVGELMNLCHGYLNALQLSTPGLEELIHIARKQGAYGAKLTGGGGGGSMISLAENLESAKSISDAMGAAGYEAIVVNVPA
ncbi:MAG: hydroxymethylglutaryl-CoA reductase, degradative [Pseudomonadota bacterium]